MKFFIVVALCLVVSVSASIPGETEFGDRCENTYQCNYGDRRLMWDCVNGQCVCSIRYIRDSDPYGRSFCIPRPPPDYTYARQPAIVVNGATGTTSQLSIGVTIIIAAYFM